MSLERDLHQMRESGFWPERVECGMQVFEVLMHLTVYGQNIPANDFWAEERRLAAEARIRAQLLGGASEITFNGVAVRLMRDVPEGRFWPSRDREHASLFRTVANKESHVSA